MRKESIILTALLCGGLVSAQTFTLNDKGHYEVLAAQQLLGGK